MTYYKVISTSVRFMWPFSWGHDESWVRQTSVGRPDALHGEPYYLQKPFLVPPSSVSSSKVSEPGMTSSKDWGKLLRPCCIGGGRSAAILGGVMHTISFLVSPKIQGLRNVFCALLRSEEGRPLPVAFPGTGSDVTQDGSRKRKSLITPQ